MSETASIPSALYQQLGLDPSIPVLTVDVNVQQLGVVDAALVNIIGDDTAYNMHTRVTDGPSGPGQLDVYQLYASSPGMSYTLTAGEQVAAVTGDYAASLTGADGTSPFLLVGNEANDTISTGSNSSGTVVLGNGSNTVNVASGDNVTVAAGHGSNTLTVGGNDTLTLGSGNDTVTATGSATVYGGSGLESIAGGAGGLTYFGSASSAAMDTVIGGSGANVFYGGAGDDTLTAGAAGSGESDNFEFTNDSTAGGSHTITNFHGADTISLNGYSASQVEYTSAASGSTITLYDGTTISVDSSVTEHVNGGQITFT